MFATSGCRCGCEIFSIDFSNAAAWPARATASAHTQTAEGITLAAGATLTLTAIADANAPFAVLPQIRVADALAASAYDFPRLKIELLESDAVQETIDIAEASAAEVDHGTAVSHTIRRVTIAGTGEAYFQDQQADGSGIVWNEVAVMIASTQYWAGDFARQLDPHTVDVIQVGDLYGEAPYILGHRGSRDGLLSSPRDTAAAVTVRITNTDSRAILITELSAVRRDSPQQDITGRETCEPQPIVCSAMPDNRQAGWTEISVLMPDAQTFSLGLGINACGTYGSFTAATLAAFEEFTWYYDGSLNSGNEDSPFEFDGLQYGPLSAAAIVQETEDPNELLLTVTVEFSLVSAYQVRGIASGHSEGHSPSYVRIEATYTKTITKRAAFTLPANVTLTTSDRTALTFTWFLKGTGTTAPSPILALTSLHHGTPTGVKTGNVDSQARFWQPGVDWSDQFGGPEGLEIEGTAIEINETWANAIEVTLGQHSV